MRSDSAIETLCVVGIIVIIVALLFSGVSAHSEEEALQVLQADGVTHITMTGYAWFGCSDSDTFHDGFKGRKNGRNVEGVVCSGWLKGSTIRYTQVGPLGEALVVGPGYVYPSTFGDNSPAVAGVKGDVSITYGDQK